MNNMKILFGADGIKEAYEESLKTSHLDIQCLSSNYEQIIGDWFDDSYCARLYSGKIKTREILKDDKGNRTYAEGKDKAVNQVRFVDDASETDVLVGDEMVIFISYNPENPFAMVVRDVEMVRAMRGMFEARWSSC